MFKNLWKPTKSGCIYRVAVASGNNAVAGKTNAPTPELARIAAMRMFASAMLKRGIEFDPFNAVVLVIKNHEPND